MNKYMHNHMILALEMAKKAGQKNEVPVGAVVVSRKDGSVIAKAYNKVESLNCPINHAEILALKTASKKLGSKYLSDYDLYVTLEPCALCAAAISLYRVGRLYYGASESKFGAVESGSRFFESKNCFHKPEVYSGIYEEEVKDLMKGFFQGLRGGEMSKIAENEGDKVI